MTEANVVKEAAASGSRIRGIHLTFAAPTVIELLARHVDFIYLDGEHGCFDWRDVEAACITAERYGLTTIARVPDNSAPTITRYLDRGVRGVVVPHIETIADAKVAVEAAYYAPLGHRSFGGSRPAYLDIADKPAHLKKSNAATSICLMIESKAGLDAIDKLAAVEGIDYLSFGMMDLAHSLGHAGDPGHADVKNAVADATKRVHAAGKRVREDFMHFAWINELILAGAKQLLAA